MKKKKNVKKAKEKKTNILYNLSLLLILMKSARLDLGNFSHKKLYK